MNSLTLFMVFAILSSALSQQGYIHTQGYEKPDHHPNYAFQYGVKDMISGDIKEHQETRDGDHVQGYYSLVEPDGTRRVVHYTVKGKSGFQAVVTKEGHAAHPAPVQKVAIAHTPMVITHNPNLDAHTPMALGHAGLAVAHTPMALGHPRPAIAHTPVAVAHTPMALGHTRLAVAHTPLAVAHTHMPVAHTPMLIARAPLATVHQSDLMYSSIPYRFGQSQGGNLGQGYGGQRRDFDKGSRVYGGQGYGNELREGDSRVHVSVGGHGNHVGGSGLGDVRDMRREDNMGKLHYGGFQSHQFYSGGDMMMGMNMGQRSMYGSFGQRGVFERNGEMYM